jgi:hypothetical protein
MSKLERLGRDRCPNCTSGTRVRITKKFRLALRYIFERLGGVPDDLALTYKCPWCQAIREFDVIDLLYGPEQGRDEGG